MPLVKSNYGIIGAPRSINANSQSFISGIIDQQLLTQAGNWPNSFTAPLVIDPYFNYTSLLLSGDGTNNANNQAFTDSSSNNFTITRNGNTTQGTFSPFSQTGWSNYLNGSSKLRTTSFTPISAGQDFTLEAWIFPTSSASLQCLATPRVSAGSWFFGIYLDKVFYYDESAGVFQGASILYNQWQHIAFSRSGTTHRLFLNGVLGATGTFTAQSETGAALAIGADNSSDGSLNSPFFGYASNFRVVIGSALYTSNFTPSTSPLTAITNTSILTCQSNRFVDNSTNAYNITVAAGSPSVQAFSPFAPATAYSASTVGGSGYFDGTGDYLTPSSNIDSSGDFTVEGWFYQLASASNYSIVIWGNNNTQFTIDWTGVGRVGYYSAAGGSMATSTSVIQKFAWTHIAWVRSSGTINIYVNGTSVISGSIGGTSQISRIGEYTTGYEFAGYISALRAVTGTAVYTGNFTPPTAPPTAIANTSLLLNFTNAGIRDATAKNVFETAGGAQISTAQSKWGGSSMYFDGTGDWLAARPNDLLSNWFGGDYTIEYWIYPNAFASSTNGGSNVYGQADPTGTSEYFSFGPRASGVVVFYYYNGAVQVVTAGTISTGTWTHLAFTYQKSSNTMRIFINGTLSTSATVSGTPSIGSTVTSNPILVGAGASSNFNGYIDDLRITRGYARYTANFTAPTAAFGTA